MMIRIENEREISPSQWETMWREFKLSARQVLGDLRAAVNHQFDQEYQARCWGAFATIVKVQPELERTIAKSGVETGWVGNPIPLFEGLIKAVVEVEEVEFQGIPEELENLKGKEEDILAVV
jgi:hypothetical protein